MTGCPVPHAIGLNLCGVSVCYRVVMLERIHPGNYTVDGLGAELRG
jgi:hypothetical protein